MKEEDCKLCSFGRSGCASHRMTPSTDFSIQGLMRTRQSIPQQPPPQHWSRSDALLLSTYLLKLGDYRYHYGSYSSLPDAGKLPSSRYPYDMVPPLSPICYYQPAGPLIKEGAGEDSRALARYHPPAPHYHPHPSHPSMMQHYTAPYYPELCYSRYYPRPAGYMPPPPAQPDPQMVGVAGEPYPPQYYAPGSCYHNTHQRPPYLEYRPCPCPMNSCPKNVHIGPATGKPPNSGGPDASTPAPPGGAFRTKARAVRDDNNANGKDPPEDPLTVPDAPLSRYHPPHPPHPSSTFSGVSPKRELCDEFRVATDGLAAEALGPPSPARGSAGACVPQPPPAPVSYMTDRLRTPPRRARIGKAMVRKTLVGEETTLAMCPQREKPKTPEDDDVLVMSSPDVECVPIDLSSSDETDRRESERLVDVKKENESPVGGQMLVRKPAPVEALREHNSPCAPPTEPVKEPPKPPAKRRYSRPKLEVEPNLDLVDGRPTNGIGEHVKLQKRRKLVPETETSPESEAKKKSPTKKQTDTPKRCNKRKSSNGTDASPTKRLDFEPKPTTEPTDARLQNPAAVEKPKIRSVLMLDKLIRKNSVDRDAVDYEPDPVELFLAPTTSPSKKVLNINNNVVGKTVPVDDTRTIADRILEKIAQATKKQTKPIKTVKSLKYLSENSVKAELEKAKTEKKKASEKNTKGVVKAKSKHAEKILLPAFVNTAVSDADNTPSTTEATASKVETTKDSPKAKLLPFKGDKDKPLKLLKEAVKTDVLKPSEKVTKLLCSKVETKESLRGPTEVMEEVCAVANPAKRNARRKSGAARRRLRLAATAFSASVNDLPAPRTTPKWSNGWMWEGPPFVAKVYLNNDVRQDGVRRCYPGMVHAAGDRVRRGDCVLLRAAARRGPEQPYVARVAHLWENPEDGEMMVSLVWYYRPEHTELTRQPDDAPDEVFASRHRDANSVACIEDKCHVLTFNEYCRYRKRLKAAEEGVRLSPSIVPPMPASDIPAGLAPADTRLPPNVSPELVLFCRKIYDFRSKKIYVPNK